MDDSLIIRNRNINRGFRKLEVWKEAIELFVFVKKKRMLFPGYLLKLKPRLRILHFQCILI